MHDIKDLIISLNFPRINYEYEIDNYGKVRNIKEMILLKILYNYFKLKRINGVNRNRKIYRR